jgi:hypothetical protein
VTGVVLEAVFEHNGRRYSFRRLAPTPSDEWARFDRELERLKRQSCAADPELRTQANRELNQLYRRRADALRA